MLDELRYPFSPDLHFSYVNPGSLLYVLAGGAMGWLVGLLSKLCVHGNALWSELL